MANTSVFTGADGSITLSTPQGPEGEAAQGILDSFELISVGRAHDVRFAVSSDVKPFHEIGQRYATELRTGNVNIRGTIGRAHINGALLSLLLGEAAGARPAASWPQPAFNITLTLENAATPDLRTSVTLHDVKIDRWSYEMPEDEFVMEQVGFRALYITTEEAS